MNTLIVLPIAFLLGCIVVVIIKSIYMPGARKIQAIMLFDKLHTIIANVEGKKINKKKTMIGGLEKWDLVDLAPDEEKRWNIYFFLWPFYTPYTYRLTYVKEKRIGEEQDGDIIVWKNEETKTCLVSRTGISDHLEWRAEYPTVTSSLDTQELASVNVYSNNMLEIKNPAKTLFHIKNWLGAANEILYGGLRGLVSEKPLHDLNQFSKNKTDFNDAMQNHANGDMGLGTFGLYLFKSVFKDFNPVGESAIALMKSYTDVQIAEQTGRADVITAKKGAEVKTETAIGEANALEINQEKIVKWKKKFLVDTGLAKVDANGNITELIPDANTKVGAEALRELSNLKGTLVLDSGSLTKMLNINPTSNTEKTTKEKGD